MIYQADKWNGQTNDGEFSIQFTTGLNSIRGFTPNRLLAVKKYYYEGSTRVAVRVNGVVRYLFGDHLGSTSVIAKADGTKESERGYKAWRLSTAGESSATGARG